MVVVVGGRAVLLPCPVSARAGTAYVRHVRFSFAKGENKRAVSFLSFFSFWSGAPAGWSQMFLPLLKLCELPRVPFEKLFIKVQLARHSFLADLLIGIERNTSQLCGSVCERACLRTSLPEKYPDNVLHRYALKHAFSMPPKRNI